MEIETAIEQLSRMRQNQGHGELRLVVQVFSPGAVGGSPFIDIQSIQAGFDWDKGRVLIQPAKPLTTLSQEDVEAIKASVKMGQSWHVYQQHKRFTETIKSLQKDLDELKGLPKAA